MGLRKSRNNTVEFESIEVDALEATNTATTEIEVANLKQTQMMMRRNN